MRLVRQILMLMLAMLLAACSTPTPQVAVPTSAPTQAAPIAPTTVATTVATSAAAGNTLRLATTTSTADTGLLDAILPDFEARTGAKVEVVAVGTGQALKLGENGDADVVLVHARAREDAFVASGFGTQRADVMYNDFIIVGPTTDPAAIKGLATAKDAFKAIADNEAIFDSRGDDSGTNTKERAIWSSIGITPTAELPWYKSLGQGMGETLTTANEQQGYTLTDRGTFLSMRARVPNLAILMGGETLADNKDKTLLNPYGVIPVNAARYPDINAALANEFVAWITNAETQRLIGAFGSDTFGQPLFIPSAKVQ